MKKIRNILFIERKLNPAGGGVQRVTYILGEAFRARGYKVWYAFYGLDTDTEIVPCEYKLCYDVGASSDDLFSLFSEFIKKNHIDTLLCQNVYTPKFCQLYERLKTEYGLIVVACLHANPDMTENKNIFKLTLPLIYMKDIIKGVRNRVLGDKYKQELRDAYRIADRYVLLSNRFIPIMNEVLGTHDAPKLRGINNPCSLPVVAAGKKENVVLVVGRMEEGQKRISNILMVWKELGERHPDWRLVLVEGGPDLGKYQRMAKKKHLKNFSFEGPSDNVSFYYQKSKIFLMTSIWEGLSMTLIEAQNAGCVPVVFDNFAAVHDIINGSNGMIIESNRLDVYRRFVEKLMNDEQLLSSMSEEAIKTSKNNFSQEKIVGEWMDLFSEIEVKL